MKLSVSNKICLLSDCTYSWCIRCWLVVVVVLLKSESISKHSTFMLDHECQYLKTLLEYTFPHVWEYKVVSTWTRTHLVGPLDCKVPVGCDGIMMQSLTTKSIVWLPIP